MTAPALFLSDRIRAPLLGLTLLMLTATAVAAPDLAGETDLDTRASLTAVEAAAGENRPDVITIAADPWCPHNCTAGSDHEGYMIDIAREVFESHGLTVEYVNTSWARALRLVNAGELDAVVGAYHEDAPGFVFPEIEQGEATNRFYTRPDDHWSFRGLSSLDDRLLVVINDYSYTALLDTYIQQHRQDQKRIWELSGPSPLDRAAQLVAQGRADVLVEERAVFTFLRQENPDLPALRDAGGLPSTRAFVAFSPELPQSARHASLLSDGMVTLRESGRLDAILARYGLEDWRDDGKGAAAETSRLSVVRSPVKEVLIHSRMPLAPGMDQHFLSAGSGTD
ncbi:substrate-binding periplasmic protein [Tamilnaduibacter salinus]|nr:transporter substrate-binding domain-containing protein [Tamilnaduibacter salinus]